MRDKPNNMTPRPTWRCRIGRHEWEGALSPGPDSSRRCVHCMKLQVGNYDGIEASWRTRRPYSYVWCECGNELSTCPLTGCAPIEGGASRVMYACGRCDRAPVFDFALAPAPIKVEVS